MADIATQRLARQVRSLRKQNNWLAVGMMIILVLQIITLGFWLDYEVRMHRAAKAFQQSGKVQMQQSISDLQRAAQQLHSYDSSGGR